MCSVQRLGVAVEQVLLEDAHERELREVEAAIEQLQRTRYAAYHVPGTQHIHSLQNLLLWWNPLKVLPPCPCLAAVPVEQLFAHNMHGPAMQLQ